MRVTLPIKRCDSCDNGLDPEWSFCPWCKRDISSEDKGIDFALSQLCVVLGVDERTINWDAATETRDGDVQSIIHKILQAKYGDTV